MKSARLLLALAVTAIGCSNDDGGGVGPDPLVISTPFDLTSMGRGPVPDRFTAELWVNGSTAYTTTWGTRTVNDVQARGNAVKIWDVRVRLQYSSIHSSSKAQPPSATFKRRLMENT